MFIVSHSILTTRMKCALVHDSHAEVIKTQGGIYLMNFTRTVSVIAGVLFQAVWLYSSFS